VTEFHCGGEAHFLRPTGADTIDDAAWADYLFMRQNHKGPQHERWSHAHGCRRWFHVLRDSESDQVLAVYLMDEAPPDLPERSS
jgi:heterotetrameric sarcosine oxidase delta subunit